MPLDLSSAPPAIVMPAPQHAQQNAAPPQSAQTEEVPSQSSDRIKAINAAPAIPARQPHLLGDWGGIRPKLEHAGITPSIQYIAMPATNLTGGDRSEVAYTAQLTFGAKFDLARVAGIKGGTFQVLITKRHGSNINNDVNIGLLQFPQAVWGAGQIWRLSQFSYLQKIGRAEFKVGRMSVGEDFGTAPCFFESLTFCGIVPGHVSPQYWYNPPVGVWGSRVRVEDKFGYTQVAVYELNPDNLDPRHGFNLGLSGARGVIVPIERAFAVKLGGDPARAGIYKFGLWHDTAISDDLVHDVDGGYVALSGRRAASQRGRWGGYVVARQQVVGPREDGSGAVNVNFSGVLTDARTNLIRSIFVGGVTMTGLIPSRPKDEFGVAFGRTHINSRLADVQALARNAGLTDRVPQHSEYVTEITYAIAVAPAVSVRPNVQIYVHPGGRSDRGAVVVLGTGVFITL